jgi:HD-GYP domain-containing protein (c-di-GMP phosphodiesterase class II)
MLNISDILKKAQKNRLGKVNKAQPVAPTAADIKLTQPQEQVLSPKTEMEKTDNQLPQFAESQQTPLSSQPDLPKEVFVPAAQAKVEADNGQLVEAYKQAIAFVQGIMNPLDNGQKGCFLAAENIIKQFIVFIKADPTSAQRLFFAEYSMEKSYIYQHSVNVCILCLRLAMALNYDQERLKQLGLAALVHDIGLIKYDNLISQPGRFSDDDYTEVKKHPISGKNILKQMAQDLNFEIFDVIHQEHERIDGSGYPYGLKDKEICEYARLIGLVDTYEAMNHERPYRNKLGNLKVIKELLNNKNKFEPGFMKVLIDIVGIFPVMTLVKLSTKEIATVVSQNQQMPQRPVVKVTHDAHGQKLAQTKIIDLCDNFSVYILDTYNDANLK